MFAFNLLVFCFMVGALHGALCRLGGSTPLWR
jgi:hypothetical protein